MDAFDNPHNRLSNHFFGIGEGRNFSIGRVGQEAEDAFLSQSGHAVQISWLTDWCKVKLEVTGTDNLTLRRMNDNPQGLWNRVGCPEESRLQIFKGQLCILIDFIELGIP